MTIDTRNYYYHVAKDCVRAGNPTVRFPIEVVMDARVVIDEDFCTSMENSGFLFYKP